MIRIKFIVNYADSTRVQLMALPSSAEGFTSLLTTPTLEVPFSAGLAELKIGDHMVAEVSLDAMQPPADTIQTDGTHIAPAAETFAPEEPHA